MVDNKSTQIKTGIYRPRDPRNTALYKLIEDYFEDFCDIYEQRYETKAGPLRAIVNEVIEKYLDCGLLHNGFCRVYCKDCKHEFLVAYSCKSRYFCPSCHQKRVLLWSDWVLEDLLDDVSHRQLVFTIPRVLRNAFHRNRDLLGKLSSCAAETVKEVIRTAFDDKSIQPGIISCIHSYGRQIRWNPHIHILTSSGGFDDEAVFHYLSSFPEREMALIFREKVFKMLIDEHFLSESFAETMRKWTYSGFSVHQSSAVVSSDKSGKINLTHYISRAPFSLSKLIYDSQKGSVIYSSKGEKQSFDPIEFIFLLVKHIPDKGQVLIRYYGWYSNASRGKRNPKEDKDSSTAQISEDFPSLKERKKRWAALIRKVYEVDPLECPRCGAVMKIISFRINMMIKNMIWHVL